jgi:ABC-2 type transport system ATP-binding protein
MSTHDIFRAKTIADVIGIMKDGRLVAQKSREELMGENIEKLYLDYMSGAATQA